MALAFTVSNESKPNTAIRAIDAGGGGAAPNARGGQRLGVAVGRCNRAIHALPQENIYQNSFALRYNL
jgi:hypothetical protein